MTAHELARELLAGPDVPVIIQKDAEGNDYSPLVGCDHNAVYSANSTWSGRVFDTKWTADDAAMSELDWDNFKKRTPQCVVLWPVN